MNNRSGHYGALLGALRSEREKVKKLNELVASLDSEEGLWERVSKCEPVKRRVIDEYLKALADKNSVALITGGITALTPVNRPKTLQDAKRIAEKIIRS